MNISEQICLSREERERKQQVIYFLAIEYRPKRGKRYIQTNCVCCGVVCDVRSVCVCVCVLRCECDAHTRASEAVHAHMCNMCVSVMTGVLVFVDVYIYAHVFMIYFV